MTMLATPVVFILLGHPVQLGALPETIFAKSFHVRPRQGYSKMAFTKTLTLTLFKESLYMKPSKPAMRQKLDYRTIKTD